MSLNDDNIQNKKNKRHKSHDKSVVLIITGKKKTKQKNYEEIMSEAGLFWL